MIPAAQNSISSWYFFLYILFCIFQLLHNEHAVAFEIRKQTFAFTVGFCHALCRLGQREEMRR